MKNIVLLCLVSVCITACGLKQQAKEMKTLAECQYRIYSIDSLTVAGTDVRELIQRKTWNVAQLPSLALGFLSQDIPLRSTVTFEIINPTATTASIQQFDYELFINEYLLSKGTYDQPVTVDAQDTVYAPISLETNIYSVLANDSLRRQIQAFFTSAQQGVKEKATLKVNIKPGIRMGDKVISYPSFFSFKKELNNTEIIPHADTNNRGR